MNNNFSLPPYIQLHNQFEEGVYKGVVAMFKINKGNITVQEIQDTFQIEECWAEEMIERLKKDINEKLFNKIKIKEG